MWRLWIRRPVCRTSLAIGLAMLMAVVSSMEARPHPGAAACRQARAKTIAVDSDDIGGLVTSSRGPEAGVWVIAETTDLHTKYRKIVVTDDRGR